MNLSSFSAANFEPVNWINESFRQNDGKEKFASDTVLKLQSFIQEINRSLEDSSKKIIVNLSKVKGELSTLNDHALTLKTDLDNVQSELSKIQIENNAPTMSKLLHIDEIRSRMQLASNSLKEADNWSTLSREMESVMQNNDLDMVANKLICMQKSLKILTNVPDYSDRVQKLNEFKANFILAMDPKLNTIFSANSVFTTASSDLEKYIQIFLQLEKLGDLKNIHQEAVCHQLILEWQKIKVLNLKDTIIDWMNSYFDLLNTAFASQCKIIGLFAYDDKEICDILISLFIDLFNKINDDLIRHLSEFVLVKQSDFNNLHNSLIQIKNLVNKLSKNVYTTLNKLSPTIDEACKPLLLLINTPYRLTLRRYFAIEQETLRNNFKETENTVAQLSEYVTQIFRLARECDKRCYQLTNSVYLFKYISLLESNFNNSIDYLKSFTNSIQLSNVHQTNQSSSPDWNHFQTALSYLQSIGDYAVQFDCFQQQTFNSWLDLHSELKNDHQSVVHNFSTLYLGFEDQTTLNKMNIESSNQLFGDCGTRLKMLSSDMLKLVLSIPIAFIENHLSQIDSTFNQTNYSLAWNNQENEEVFKLSITPNEYITQIGQYLLTIPQHIEHLIVQENISLKFVFKHFDQAQFLQMQILADQSTKNCNRLIDAEDAANFFLEMLIEKTIQLFVKRIQNLSLVNRKAQLTLIADIEYLNDVIDDLGLSAHPNLLDLIMNLKANPVKHSSK